eukprot:CAMPEP_0183309500 /NCGR_PEP_ID=MMETSP0160_2-20130417/25379_1 /TAXON_ID=2839 ORGANISM="Odontella Sinensis, Strain Grunow 1884" /NCGR_SAMPLE_ID=MMETSP0160_2 /ASSEMBLY_ACC=CAM_ASM_000250 /LENGTH=370 /DNA_ID=CAMNT_0025473541 /DNA_START=47 /DNA_END=1159 /DNA_ORIENTATION=-
MSDIEAQRAKAGFTFSEDVSPGLKVEMELKSLLLSTQSQYQKIDVIDTYFGRTLVTDGKTQSAEFDEFAYHESLVHPPMMKSAILANDDAKPRSIFIGGGGELATAREVLRHKSVERLVMVDLDEKVIEVSKRYLPEWGGEKVESDPRLELIVGDAYAYLMDTTEKFDVIIMDISDPIEAGPGIMLYTKEFYAHAKTLLNSKNGVFVTQAGCADSIPPKHAKEGEQDTSCFGPIKNTLSTIFDCVIPYSTNIPSFAGDWGFVMAFNAQSENTSPHENATQIAAWTNESTNLIDELIEQRITKKGIKENGHKENGHKENGHKENGHKEETDALSFYDGITHQRMFSLTKPLRKSLILDTRIMTKENPIFMF